MDWVSGVEDQHRQIHPVLWFIRGSPNKEKWVWPSRKKSNGIVKMEPSERQDYGCQIQFSMCEAHKHTLFAQTSEKEKWKEHPGMMS